MVVTRRTPIIPAPPTSRTNSSQAVPRSGRQQPSFDGPYSSQFLVHLDEERVNGAVVSSKNVDRVKSDTDVHEKSSKEKKEKSTFKNGKKPSSKGMFKGFMNFSSTLLLLFFTFYTLSVCPQDTHLHSPICRGLFEYRRLVLEPYVFPPIQAALGHPIVAPYIDTARPYVNGAIEATSPVLLRAQAQWNAFIVPQWDQHVIPQWNKHISPYVFAAHAKLEPYFSQVAREYNLYVSPCVQTAVSCLQRLQHTALPYVSLAASKTYDGYQAVKPYALALGRHLREALSHAIACVQAYRRQFVDPHVARIWEKVKELSTGQVDAFPSLNVPPDSQNTIAMVLDTDHASSSSTGLVFPKGESTNDGAGHVLPAQEIKTQESSFAITDAASLSSADPSHISSSVLGVDLSTTLSAVETLEPAASVTPSSDLRTTPEVTSVIPLTTDHASPPAVSSSSLLDASTSMPLPDSSASPSVEANFVDGIDLDAFYAELGLADPLDLLAHPNTEPVVQHVESEEVKAEKLRMKKAETAMKRAHIEARHAQWEQVLQDQIEDSKSKLILALEPLRSSAAADLQSSISIRASIDGLFAEAEKYLKGAEVYLKNLKSDSRRKDERLDLWDRVIEKISAKFGERLAETEGVVNAWYKRVFDQETQQVAKFTAQVKEIAERGQVDLGLDYAWLDDVTYDDWQRYHALLDASDKFTEEALSIQNGTHSLAPLNPIEPLISDLESEIQDVIIGFETRLRRIKRDGERGLSQNQTDEEKASSLEPQADPEISTLPVPDNDIQHGSKDFVPPIVIGRTKEEVKEAIERAEALERKADAKSQADEVVQGVAHLVEDVGLRHVQPDYHTEL